MLLKSDYHHRYVAATHDRYRYDPTILPGILLHLSDLSRAYARGLTSRKLAAGRYDRHRVDARSQLSAQMKQCCVKSWYRLRCPDFKRHFAMNMGMLDELLALPKEYFYDLRHLLQPGRLTWQQLLAQELVQLIGADGKGAGTPP